MLKLLRFRKSIICMDYSTLYFKTKHNYEDSLKSLNSLISNANVLMKSCVKGPQFRMEHIPKTKLFCERAEVQISEIDKLNIIHVAGTKGKGSTCTYIEAILRNYGYKTGLFTSPHLKEVRERIRINGSPISTEDFSDYFWQVYGKLSLTQKDSTDMPFYFQFLTIMAFNVFLKEKVDYVILETGIGGRFDPTNIISRPTIACITALGYDHTDILGSTIAEIAWNKAGIIKPGSFVFTCNNQPRNALAVIENEVKLTDAKLLLVPVEGEKMLNVIDKRISIHSENSMLASAICQKILNKDFVSNVNVLHKTIELSSINCCNERFDQIIQATPVTGRYQKIKKGSTQYFIDGAHTVESIMTTVEWFTQVAENEKFDKRYLIFMITGNRSIENLLSKITVLKFDGILLSPLIPFNKYQPLDFAVDDEIVEKEKLKLKDIAATWIELNKSISTDNYSCIKFFNCFSDIVDWLDESGESVQVLVVGSLHLVGCALVVLSQ